MRAIRTGKSYSSRSRTSVSTALIFVLTFCVSGIVARAQVPASGVLGTHAGPAVKQGTCHHFANDGMIIHE